MLKFYSYYNVGGYKDMYLGDSSMKATETHYLPLLSIWKKKAVSGDPEAEAKVKLNENLSKIQILSSKDNFGLPEEATLMFSHGGYKVINKLTSNGESIFAIRDIESSSKDESGRNIPFLMVIVGTTEDDAITLEKVTAYACSHLETFSKELADLFYYDAEKNGVVFKLSSMNVIVTRIANEGNNSILTIDGLKTVQAKRDAVSLLVLPEGISKDYALTEQRLKGVSVQSVSIGRILPLDNQKKLIAVLKNIKGIRNSIFADRRILCIVGGAVILGLLIGYFCGRQ